MYYYCYVCICSVLGILFYCVARVLFVCKCVLYYCHRVPTQLQLTNISYYIISLLLQEPTASVYLGRMNPLHTFQSFTVYYDIILSPVCVCHQSGIPVSVFPLTTLHAYLLSFACYLASPSYSSFFDDPNNTWWRGNVTKFRIMQFSPSLSFPPP